MSVGLDGIINHKDAKLDCPVCDGGGLLDDGDNYGCILVPCPCTGQASEDVVLKVCSSYPIMNDYMRN